MTTIVEAFCRVVVPSFVREETGGACDDVTPATLVSDVFDGSCKAAFFDWLDSRNGPGVAPLPRFHFSLVPTFGDLCDLLEGTGKTAFTDLVVRIAASAARAEDELPLMEPVTAAAAASVTVATAAAAAVVVPTTLHQEEEAPVVGVAPDHLDRLRGRAIFAVLATNATSTPLGDIADVVGRWSPGVLSGFVEAFDARQK